MEEKKNNNNKFLMFGCIGVIVLLVACCVASFCLISFAPTYVMGKMVSNEPLAIKEITPWSETKMYDLSAKLQSGLSSPQGASLSAEEVMQLARSEGNLDLFAIDINENDEVVIDLSSKVEESGKYFNLHAVGDIEIQNGKFEKFIINELEIGNFDIGTFLQGQDLADRINVEMSNQQMQNGEDPLKDIEYFGVQEGEFKVKLYMPSQGL